MLLRSSIVATVPFAVLDVGSHFVSFCVASKSKVTAYFLSAYCEDTREIAAPSALALPQAINYGQVPHASALAGATALCACRVQRTVECFRALHAQG